MELTAVDLFSGGGGASIGLHRLDQVDLVAAAEIDDRRREIYNRNLPVKAADIDLTDEEAFYQICETFGLTRSEINLVIGCPPCQKYSSLQDTTGPVTDDSGKRPLYAYIDLILKASPDIVVFENVPGLLNRGNQQHISEVKDYLRKAGYGFRVGLFNMANYGVPQKRERTIGLGIKGVHKQQIVLPEPTHLPPEEAKQQGKPEWKTVADAIGDLPSLEAGESCDTLPFDGHRARNHQKSTVEFIKKIPQNGGSRTDLPDEEQLECHQNLENKNSAGNVYGRMAWNKPGPTLTSRCMTPSSGRFVHPEQHRGITPREAARIMTFPDDYELPEKNTTAEKLIGNAVPPTFIETVLREFLSEHENDIKSRNTIAAD